MTTSRHIRRIAALGALACALLGASAAFAVAAPAQRASAVGSLANPTPAQVAAARAQARYYATYGSPEPITASAGSAPSDGSPLLIIILSGVVVLAMSFTVVHRRSRARQDVPRVAV